MGKDKAAFKPLNAYLLMADLETDENWEILHETQSLEGWARREISGKIGYDPALTPISNTRPARLKDTNGKWFTKRLQRP